MKAPRYIGIDGSWHGTGLYNSLDRSELDINDLGLSAQFLKDFSDWLEQYKICDEDRGGDKLDRIAQLDLQGMEFCHRLKEELPGCKVQYFSDGTGHLTLCT